MVIAQQVKSRDRTDDIDITNTDLRSIGVVGARSLSSEYEDKVGDIVEDLLGRGFHIASGGAVGADEFAIARLVHIGMADRCTVYTP
jgi:predicted Rossmann fold nucleotide-binding protein DprA/Smf involved in DNA uptake